MKKISVVIPTYNEEENVVAIWQAVTDEINKNLERYDYEILFIDNCSKDKTRGLLEEVCKKDHHVKAIFNAKNFGQFNSPYYGLLQSTGDCAILLCADFQDPIDMISQFVLNWEKGYKIVIGVKTTSKENRIMYFLRTIYYKLIKKFSEVEQIEHFTGFGLYDRSFINVLKELDDSSPFLRGLVAELGYKRIEIPYEQQKRRAGKTSNNFYSLYDAAMLSVTSYTKIGMRLATFGGFIIAFACFIVGIIYLILKLLYWDRFTAGLSPILIGMFFLGAIQLFFMGFLGEYILAINTRVRKRPLVIEEKRINFEEKPLIEK